MAEQVMVIDGFKFRYDDTYTKGWSGARISLTNLAKLLGYKAKQDLKRLAVRNAKHLTEFGLIGTAPIKLRRRGGGYLNSTEPAYNYHQAYYLMMRSETEVARKMAARLTVAFFTLVKHFLRLEVERNVAQKAELATQHIHADDSSLVVKPAAAVLAVARNNVELAETLQTQESRILQLSDLVARVKRLESVMRVPHEDELLPAFDDFPRQSVPPTQYSPPPKGGTLAPTASSRRRSAKGLATYTVHDYMRAYNVNMAVYPATVIGKIASALYRERRRMEPPYSDKGVEVNGRVRAHRKYPRKMLEDAVAQYGITARCEARQKLWDNQHRDT